MKIYIAGKITGLSGYRKKFQEAQERLEGEGNTIMNPAILPEGFTHEEYMKICYSMIDICDGVFFLDNWEDSEGAKLEHIHAIENGKWIKYQ